MVNSVLPANVTIWSSSGSSASDWELTPRELEVLKLVVAGLTNDAIAARLQISPRTVQSHVGQAMMKSGSASRTQLAVNSIRAGIVSLWEGADGEAAL